MEFILFLLVTGALVLRPQDLFPWLSDIPVYNILIVANLVLASPAIVGHLHRGLRYKPATICVGGIFAAIVGSLLVRSDLAGAIHWGGEFAKVVAYFLLMIAVLTTPRRFGAYLASVVALTIALAALAVAHFHGYLSVDAISHAREITYDAYGEPINAFRLSAFGVFADPNDLSMIVVMSMLICLGGVSYRRWGSLRFALLLPLLFLGYSLALTQSRGGLLALVIGLAAFLICRFGATWAAVSLAALIPLVFVAFSGRQTDIGGSIAAGTGSTRTELWYAGLQMIKWHPLIGMGHGRFVQEQGLVAHSSYLQALSEWGLVGGTMFVGLFFVVLYSVWRIKRVRREILAPALRSFHPFVFGALAGYTASMLTLTRCDVVPTYLVAGLGVTFERLARRHTSLPPLEFSPPLLMKMAGASLAYLALVYVYIRFVYRMF
jgi:putative inorganic carbon (HCO3(-)) transporter